MDVNIYKEILNYLNTKLNNINLPILILEDFKDKKDYIQEDCASDITGIDLIKFILYHKVNKELIGYLFLNKIGECIYINYRCISPKYRSKKLGTFLAYISIYYALHIDDNIKAVISYGECADSQQFEVPNREGPMCLSQKILIEKFGFYDNFKIVNKKMNIDKLKKNSGTCGGEFPETILYLRNENNEIIEENLEKYRKYESTFNRDKILVRGRKKTRSKKKKRSLKPKKKKKKTKK